jgi:hypothetical protein
MYTPQHDNSTYTFSRTSSIYTLYCVSSPKQMIRHSFGVTTVHCHQRSLICLRSSSQLKQLRSTSQNPTESQQCELQLKTDQSTITTKKTLINWPKLLKNSSHFNKIAMFHEAISTEISRLLKQDKNPR